jgi:hypothetical protein
MSPTVKSREYKSTNIESLYLILLKTNKYTIKDFATRLSSESWDSIFNNDGNMYVDLLNHYLRIFYTSFPFNIVTERVNKNHWVTLGIRTSYSHKNVFLLSRDIDRNMKA